MSASLLDCVAWLRPVHAVCANTVLLPWEAAFFPHEPDHVVARKHGGTTTEDNLALACFDCNRFKGYDIASVDPQSGRIVALFNPRTQARIEIGAILASSGRYRQATGK